MDGDRGRTALGKRIVVVGPSCSGKSTLAEQLGAALGLPYVELDALFWRPNWTEPRDEEFAAQLREATASESWVVAGNYVRHTMPVIWPRAETVIWLDFGMSLVTWRVLRRSWRRWRTNELLWGTNHERFLPQLKLWDKESSLIAFNFSARNRWRNEFPGVMADRNWAHVRFVRLRSPGEVQQFVARIQQSTMQLAERPA